MRTQNKEDRGFTLVELLIVIVILGILATITVFAVRGITSEGEESACLADRKNIETAQEAHMAKAGSYVAEDALVTAGLLRSASGNVDVAVAPDGESYTTTYVGTCVGVGVTTTAGSGPTTTAPVSGPPSSVAGMAVDGTFGTGSTYFVALGFGTVGRSRLISLASDLGNGYETPTNFTVLFIDEGTPGISSAQLEALAASGYTTIWMMDQSLGDTVTPGGTYGGLSAPYELNVTLARPVWVAYNAGDVIGSFVTNYGLTAL